MSTDGSIDRDLCDAVTGDRNALARLLVACAPDLSKRIGARLRFNPFAEFSVEDVLQETFVDVVRGIDTFRPADGTPFVAWLEKVADHRLAKMLQHRTRKKRGGAVRHHPSPGRELRNSVKLLVEAIADPQAATPSELAHRDELIAAVRQELELLPNTQREAVRTYFLDDRSLESTAAVLDKPPAAVRGLLYRAKRAMRAALGNSRRWFLGR